MLPISAEMLTFYPMFRLPCGSLWFTLELCSDGFKRKKSSKSQKLSSADLRMEQQARVAFLRRQAQFLLYVSNKTELHQSQAPF